MFDKNGILDIVTSAADDCLGQSFDSDAKKELSNFVAESISNCILSNGFIDHINLKLGERY